MPTIDEEITELNTRIKDKLHTKDTNNFIADLQYSVLSAHSSVEKKLEESIFNQLEVEIPRERTITWRAIELWASSFMSSLSFMNKLDLVNRFGDNFSKNGVYKICRKLNNYRNEFAHTDNEQLSKKYNSQSPENKVNLRNLLRNMDDSLGKIDDYIEESHADIIHKQQITQDSRKGIEENVVDKKSYKKINLISPLKKVTLLHTEDASDALGDFVVSRGLYIEVGKDGKPVNELLNNTITLLSIDEEMIKFEDIA